MNRLTMTKELVKIADILDNSKLHNEANSLTKIAEDMMDDNFDPMVYDSDEEASDDLDAQADDFDNLINTLMDAERNGDLNDEDIASIMNILNLESGRSTMQMSLDEDDDMDMDDEDMDDDFDMGPEKEPFDYDSMEDEEDSMYGAADSRFPDLDEDDF